MTSSVAAAPPTPARRNRRVPRNWNGWIFVAPFMVLFLFVFVAPLIYAIYLSVFRTQLLGGTAFVGFANYERALTDPQFWEAFSRVAGFLVVQVPVMVVLALIAALALDSGRLLWPRLFRVTIFLPYAVPGVVAALVWGFVYGKDFGLVKDLQDLLHVSLPDPLSHVWILPSIGNIVTWEFVGYNMVVFYAALRTVPEDLYEAASLDGAGTFRVIANIKLPALRQAILISTIFSVMGSFQLFNEPQILKPLAPDAISSYFTPNMYAYNLAFGGQDYNYSATIAIVLGLITVIVAYTVQLFGRRGAN